MIIKMTFAVIGAAIVSPWIAKMVTILNGVNDVLQSLPIN